ncbi:MAG: hypothetical protein MUF86_12015, partial [Akkermansiaceae bacterium]|nr:hypothetical protein [Akkermansiaceae bacterium]
ANGDQTGGKVWFRDVSSSGAWQWVPLQFHANVGGDQFWKGIINLNTVGIPGLNIVEYYIEVNFNQGASPAPPTTYLYGGDLDTGSQLATTDQGEAREGAYSFRDRPAYIFHVDNRIINGASVSFFAKVGYVNDPNNPFTRWADNGALYYTTDGTDPAGSLGVPAGTTQVAFFQYTNAEQNPINGSTTGARAMFWETTVSNMLAGLPLGTTVKYKVGFWNSTNAEEKFGDHNAGPENNIFQFTNGQLGDPVLTVQSERNGVLDGNYTTSKFFIDEIAGTGETLNITFAPGEMNVTEVEVVTNLNQRDFANVDKGGASGPDGMEFNQTEGIIGTGPDHYYRKYPMADAGGGLYTLSLAATRTGAYRLTARWKVDGNPAWRWYTFAPANRRDHAITVSPVDARDLRVYEINTLTVEAKDNGGFIERSTFEDLWDAPGAPRTGDNRGFNLDYLNGLGVNCLWFQPIHPTAIDGREPSGGWDTATPPYNPGSPYAVRNFFEVNPWMSAAFNGTDIVGDTARNQGMASFQAFAGAADTADIDIMLDAPFNHTGFDVEFGPYGDLFERDSDPLSNYAGGKTEIRNYETRFFSRQFNYGERATLNPFEGPAAAPDRDDFGKWRDVKDVYFGSYDALVRLNPFDNGFFLSSGDRFNYAATGQGTDTNPESANWNSNDFTQGGEPRNVTRQVWKYFAQYAPHWLEKTRLPGQNRNSLPSDGDAAARYAWDARGIDGLRCDFGQGLPPQAWEYIINVARSYKWNFVMMSESLDGGSVTYRSNRHFDILNENIVFPLKVAGNTPDYRAIFEDRRNAYGQGLVLLNNTSHDEENYENIWFALMRYNVASTIDGAPMIFMGQEIGVTRDGGFTHYETNFGKKVAHFKRFNSMQPGWINRLASPNGEEFLWDAYAAPGQARKSSPALRSGNRWYLNRMADGQPRNEIWAVAKYQTPNGSPAFHDVVFAFVNLRTDQGPSDTFDVDIEANGSNLFGIKPNRKYNVKNIAAFAKIDPNRRNIWLWDNQGTPEFESRTGQNILDNGVFVGLNSLPVTAGGWNGAPHEVQFLKLHDVTPPPTFYPGPGGFGTKPYTIGPGNTLTFYFSTLLKGGIGEDENISHFIVDVGTFPGGNDVADDAFVDAASASYSFNAIPGTVYHATVRTVSATGIEAEQPGQSDSGGPSFLFNSPLILLSADGDQDGDGQSNAAEETAGTNPLDSSSLLKATAITAAAGDVTVTITSVPGITYQLETSTSLLPGSWQNAGDPIEAAGFSTQLPHPGGAGDPKRFYRAKVVP